MEIEQNRPVGGEQHIKVAVAEAVGVLAGLGEGKQLHHIQHPHLQLGNFPPQDGHRRQGFLGGHIPRTGHHQIRFIGLLAATGLLAAPIVGGPVPQADPLGHVGPGLLQLQVLEVGLLVRNDDVAHVGFGQGHLGHGQ